MARETFLDTDLNVRSIDEISSFSDDTLLQVKQAENEKFDRRMMVTGILAILVGSAWLAGDILGWFSMPGWLVAISVVMMIMGMTRMLNRIFKKGNTFFPKLNFNNKTASAFSEVINEGVNRIESKDQKGVFAGVCAWLSSTTGLPAAIWRAIFVALLFMSGGAMIFAYIILAFVKPKKK